jgi:hypothetical protein
MDNMFLRMIEGRGRLVFRPTVQIASPDGQTAIVGGNGARYGLIFTGLFADVTIVNPVIEIGAGGLTTTNRPFVLTPFAPVLFLSYENIGDMIFQSFTPRSVSAADSVTATEIIWHPPED